MVFVFNLVTKESKRHEFIHSFDMMKTVPGFKSISLLQDHENKNKFLCVEYWDNQKSHAEHAKAVSIAMRDAWLDLLEEISAGQFYEMVAEIKP